MAQARVASQLRPYAGGNSNFEHGGQGQLAKQRFAGQWQNRTPSYAQRVACIIAARESVIDDTSGVEQVPAYLPRQSTSHFRQNSIGTKPRRFFLGAIANDFVFVHIPKTAGTSLAKALCAGGAMRTAGCAEVVKACMQEPPIVAANHLRARDLLGYFGAAEWRRRFTFGVVRNPWDRLVSTYTFIRSKPDHPQHLALREQSFEEFVREFAGLRGPDLWLDDERGIQLVDRVYRFENLVEVYPDILQRCGLSEAIRLPHVNTSHREHYRSYFDEELSSLVASRCQHEIKRFGYSF